jgi:hypothetical protein
MSYSTRITRRQVIQAFDLYQKRCAAQAFNFLRTSPLMKNLHLPRQLTPKRLPPALTLNAIAKKCGICTQTLTRLVGEDFRIKEYHRGKVLLFAEKYYRV